MKNGLVGSVLVLMLSAIGCSSSNPAQPSGTNPGSPSGSGPLGNSPAPFSASIVAPRPLTPATNAVIRNADQPVTLVVQNAVITKQSGTAYTFEVATDSGFTSIVQTKAPVPEGPNGQTSVSLDPLPASKDYYWHARASSGGTTGVFGAIAKFTIGPSVILNAPIPIAPLTGSQTTLRPALRVTNATRQGPVGPITYKFEIAADSLFGSIVLSGINTEGVNETGFIPTTDLPSLGLLYWRATAIDAVNGVTSASSAVQSFTANKPSQAGLIAAELGVVLWPGVQPPGAVGNATMGSDWTPEPLTSFTGVRFMNPPVDELQVFDLLDRGFDPQGAIDWMHANGYPTIGVWYPAVQVIAFQWEYIAYINGRWDIVLRLGA